MIRAFFNFDSFVFPRIVTVIYWIGLVFIGLSTLVGFFGMLFGGNYYGGAMGTGGGIIGALMTLIGGIIGVIGWRLLVEFWLVIFSIRDLLRDIRDGTKS